MKFRFLTVPARLPADAEAMLNAFCAQHRVLAVDRQLVPMGAESYWAICITFIEGSRDGPGAPGARRERIDYKEILGERDFAVYAELRSLRKTLSEQEGVPAYALFTNEQLAEMVTRRARTPGALAAIEGVGKARLEKYAAAFIAVLQQSLDAAAEPTDEAPAD